MYFGNISPMETIIHTCHFVYCLVGDKLYEPLAEFYILRVLASEEQLISDVFYVKVRGCLWCRSLE